MTTVTIIVKLYPEKGIEVSLHLDTIAALTKHVKDLVDVQKPALSRLHADRHRKAIPSKEDSDL